MADFLYKGVVDWFLEQMSQEALRPGDKMPSLRSLSKQLGFSLNTVIHGYELLCQDGWIESRPKSGYFVCHRSDTKPALLLAGESLHATQQQSAKIAWSSLAHHCALVDQTNLLQQANGRHLDTSLPVLGKGHLAVREVVSDYLKEMGIKTRAAQLWLGRSPLTMLTQSIQNLTQQDDTVLLLTPCDPRLAGTLQSLGRRVVSITAGDRGVDLDLAIRCLRDEPIKLIILPGQFAFPTGQLISNLSLRRWLAIIEETQLPVIEWDLCSHLAHRSAPLMTYKSLDQHDHIVYIGGVESHFTEQSLAWCIPGRHQDRLDGAFLAADMALNETQQAALSDLLQTTSKRCILRRGREVWANAERIKAKIDQLMAEQVSVVTNKGGLALWMRLTKPVTAETTPALMANFRHAMVPGALLSPETDADYWLALNVTSEYAEPLIDGLVEYLQADQQAKTSEVEEAEQAVEELEVKTETEESDNTKSDTEKKESTNNTSEPLYNPMLDLINHDFG
ncbi:GntR family transcriptional regulator [Marinomonas sp. THO17]|uniref:GntR family transcriptional regulator n=1 Tax=Marinomonas sp. THO17 TaxID=3149048 RepID=UPI00336BBFF5